MRIDKDENGAPQLTIGASDRFGPAMARHLAMLTETSGGPIGDVAKLRQLAGRMEAWRAAHPVTEPPPEPEPQPAVEPLPTHPEPEPEPEEPVEIPEAASAGKRSRR